MKSNYTKEQITAQHSNINGTVLSSSVQLYQTIMSTSLGHFQSRKLNLIYAETIDKCAKLVLKTRTTYIYDHRNLSKFSRMHHVSTHIYITVCTHFYLHNLHNWKLLVAHEGQPRVQRFESRTIPVTTIISLRFRAP